MLIQTHRHSAAKLRFRTRLYHVIDFIGRWSMVDIFMVSILVAVMRFGWIASITPDFGIVCFAGVVILTLFAAKTFDPRLMWDVAATRSGNSSLGQGVHVIAR
jgi:paraquat-inducible protein A